jgi:hexokinase
MIAGTLKDPNCHVGIILGTGTNACYMEQISEIPKWTGDKKEKQVIINTEWGAFGDSASGDLHEEGALSEFLTEFDKQLDEESLNPGKQRYEKMISGMYLGELSRLALVKLTQQGLAFDGKPTQELLTKDIFETAFMSPLEALGNSDHLVTRSILTKLFKQKYSEEDLDTFVKVCKAISGRGARLAAVGVVAVVEKINKVDDCVVAIDGSVFQFHPTFSDGMKEALDELVPGHKIQLKGTEDGSGKGAALVAAVAARMKAEK